MTRSATVVLGDDGSGIRLTYVRSRRVLCLRGWQRPGVESPPIEIPLAELAQRLGIEEAGIAGRPRYLVFGGLHSRPKGGAGDLVGAFDSEDRARQRFDELRRRLAPGTGWGELAVLDAWGRVKRLGWFGRDDERSWKSPPAILADGGVSDSQQRPAGRGWRRNAPAQALGIEAGSTWAGAGRTVGTDGSTPMAGRSASGRGWVRLRSLVESVRSLVPATLGLQP